MIKSLYNGKLNRHDTEVERQREAGAVKDSDKLLAVGDREDRRSPVSSG